MTAPEDTTDIILPLRDTHKQPLDDACTFYEKSHEYVIEGVLITFSVTKLVRSCLTPQKTFNADKILEQHFDTWFSQGIHSEYYPIFQACGDDKEKAKRFIKISWKKSSILGTLLHNTLERHLEQHWHQWHVYPPLNTCSDIDTEILQFFQWAQQHTELMPLRTELIVHYKDRCAGRIDALFQHRITKEIYIVDYKRVKPKYTLLPDEFSFYRTLQRFPHIAENKFNEYSMQVCLYDVLLEHSRPEWKASKRFLLRLHAQLPTFQWIECADYRKEARQLLATLDEPQ